MKFSFISLTLLLFALTRCINNQDQYKILVITGGKQFERENFLKIFDEMNNIDYKELVQPEANKIYSSKEIENIDAIVFYDFNQEINLDQKKAFLEILAKGKGMVFLHHSLVSYQEWHEYEKIIGGRYYQSTNKLDSTKFTQSTFKHDVEIPVHIVDRTQPITEGIEDFVIHDEVYGNYKILPEVTPLITTMHPESEKIIGWTNEYDKSRIVYIQLGHDHHAYNNGNYRRLIKQSIDWVVGKK